ncbi:hypothetical protein R3P38DRAFT_2769080 [Favolaschia claudopus]|uniref:Uncharacterized protein n=1 Tax=Favolaschia claudopus TaxID=2862362 RepID=A0AAW0CR00_9AGAR
MPDTSPKSSKRTTSLFIDDSAEDRSKVDHSESEDADSVHSSDKAFINDASDLSVDSKDDNNMDITINDDSDLSSLSQDERDEDRPMIDATTRSDEEVIVVETPLNAKQSRKARTLIQTKSKVITSAQKFSLMTSRALAMQPDDSMFTKRGSVKARSSKAASSPDASVRKPAVESPIGKPGQKKPTASASDGLNKEEGQPKIFLRVQKSKATDLKSNQVRRNLYETVSGPVQRSPGGSDVPDLAHSTTPRQLDMKTAMESVLSEMLDSRLEGIAQSLMLQLAPMLKQTAAVKSEETNIKVTDKVVPMPSMAPVTNDSGMVDDDMDTALFETTSPSSVTTVEGITVAAPNPTALDDPVPTNGSAVGIIRWTDPVTPPRKATGVSFTDNTFLSGSLRAVPPFTSESASAFSNLGSPTAHLATTSGTSEGQPQALQSGFRMSDNLARMFASNRLDSSKRAATEPDACGVSEDRLQDVSIKDVYSGLCKQFNNKNFTISGGRKLLPSFVRSGSADDWNPGGRLAFSYWFETLNQVSGITLFNAMSFKRSGRFFAPQREAPDSLSLAQEPGTSPYSYKLYAGNEYAIAVTPGLCFESYVVEPFRSGGTPPRFRKFISVLFHNQDWERFVSFVCCCFDRRMLHTQMTGKALQFSTKMNTVDAMKQTSVVDRLNKYTNDSTQSSSASKRPSPTNKFSLEYTDEVPVYDARHLDFDFTSDLPKLATTLPRWPEKEIPEGSFVTVGYTVSTYKGTASGHTDKVLHLGCNLQWVIVCGTAASKETN